MSNHDTRATRRALASAFREATWSLMGLFEMHDVEPALVQAAAAALGRIYQAHTLERSKLKSSGDVQRLLRKLNRDHAATTAA